MKHTLQMIAARAAKGLQRIAAFGVAWRPDALMAAGAGALSYGASLIYPPAGWLVAGALALTAGVLAARKAA
jgi:hypothetical protein